MSNGAVSRFPRPINWRVITGIISTFLVCSSPLAASEPGPAALFGKRCSGCHTYGKGVKVGPDLKGVTERRQRSWLLRFIRSSRSLIRAQDETALRLFRQFDRQEMPDWTELSESDIQHLLDYFAAGGPERKSPAERHADAATAADVTRGRLLFSGKLPLKYADQICNSCHAVEGDPQLAGGGTLGPDLTTTYLKYQDRALTSFLKQPCFPTASAAYLTEEELFALKAYLHDSASVHEARNEQSAARLARPADRNTSRVPAALQRVGGGRQQVREPAKGAPR